MDLKIGKNTYEPHVSEEKKAAENKKTAGSTSATLGFRVSGVTFKDAKGVC